MAHRGCQKGYRMKNTEIQQMFTFFLLMRPNLIFNMNVYTTICFLQWLRSPHIIWHRLSDLISHYFLPHWFHSRHRPLHCESPNVSIILPLRGTISSFLCLEQFPSQLIPSLLNLFSSIIFQVRFYLDHQIKWQLSQTPALLISLLYTTYHLPTYYIITYSLLLTIIIYRASPPC